MQEKANKQKKTLRLLSLQKIQTKFCLIIIIKLLLLSEK